MTNITLIGTGTIGLSFCQLHLSRSATDRITVCDPRADLDSFLSGSEQVSAALREGRVRIARSLEEACSLATDIVQEQGPENEAFKTRLWPRVEALVRPDCLLWSSTSGIPASVQGAGMASPGRLVVVHPFNPPSIMPLIEVVPSPATPEELVRRAVEYFEAVGHRPVVLRKETVGFVANRLAFVLLREAVHLVDEGVVSVEDVDAIVENSIGLRWSVKGPFASYHDGGGRGGLAAFLANIGGTIQSVWDDAGVVNFARDGHDGASWLDKVVKQTGDAYGPVRDESLEYRDRATRRVLEVVRDEKGKASRTE
jgi:3-hydroxyacyl-CoA dehydrogenase